MTPYLLTHTLLRLCPTKPWRSGWHTLLPGMLCCLGALHSPIQAQELYKQGTVTFDINSAEIDPARDNNRATIADINLFVEKAATDSNTVVSDICIGGYASPEGPTAFNTRIAQARMQALRRAIILGGGKNLPISRLHINNAHDGLSELETLVEQSDITGRERVMQILRDSISYPSVTRRLKILKRADGGRLWKEVVPLLDRLRYATVTFTYRLREAAADVPDTTPDSIPDSGHDTPSPTPPDTIARTHADTNDVSMQQPAAVESERRDLYASVKSNLLYDAMLIPSIGAEIYLGRDWSVSAQWSYAWWSRNSRHRYWRYYGGDISLRRWLGRAARSKPLTGHHIGLYAQMLTYDFESGGKGQMGNKFNYGGGIEYGYSLPVGRRINFDFTIGLGYIGGKYYEYTPIDNHYVWQATRRRHWFGPTKAEVSLVWLIGRGNRNAGKGGGR